MMESCSEGRSTCFCGKSIKNLRHGFVTKYMCVVKNSGNSSCNVLRMRDIQQSFKKIKYLSKPFKCINNDAYLPGFNLDAKRVLKYFVREIGHLSFQIFVRQI